MVIKNKRKFTAYILVMAMLAATFLTGFTYQEGIENVYYETESIIYENTTYHEQLGGNDAKGIQRAYFVKADIMNSGLKPYVFEGEVRGTYTMSTMVNTLESQGYHIVAGINGDVYDTATGTPKGLVIHDGKIKTSGYAPEYVIAFDKYGIASLQKVELEYSLKGMINVPTPIPVPEEELLNTTESTIISDPSSENLNDKIIIDSEGQLNQNENNEQIINVPTEFSHGIGFFNVPLGGAKALHLYNRNYAATTRTNENCVEVILETRSSEETELSVGGTIIASVVEVRNGSSNTPIKENQLILSTAADSSCAVQISQLIPGSTVEITVNDRNGGLTDCKEAIGVYYVLYDNGQFISTGTNKNPRTIIGIKQDGTIMLYVLDGRQPNFSTGLGLTDAAKHLIDLGCTTVVNMDGGGSSVIAVREGGIDSKANIKNSPSSGSERKTTNGFFLVYEGKGGNGAENLHTYASQPLAMPGADIQLTTYASNEQYEPVPLRRAVEYSVSSNSDSRVNESGLFTAGSDIGDEVIEVRSGNLRTTLKVSIQDDITFTTNVQNLVIDPGKTSDINVTAKFGYAPIASKDSLFTWGCDENIGTIDNNGLFRAGNETGISGNIYVEYNGKKKTIPVQIGASMIDFDDTKTHWAREYIGKLAARGVVNGMGDNLYQPDSPLTRAQFLTMLAKTIYGLDVSQSASAGFKDVPETEWFYNYVNWGFENGIVKGIDNETFAPNDKITREQMAIMLDNFTESIELILPEVNNAITFTDSDLISSWAAESVEKIISSGIMGGYPEGDFKPQGNATRAEAATVIYKLLNIRDNIAKTKQMETLI